MSQATVSQTTKIQSKTVRSRKWQKKILKVINRLPQPRRDSSELINCYQLRLVITIFLCFTGDG